LRAQSVRVYPGRSKPSNLQGNLYQKNEQDRNG